MPTRTMPTLTALSFGAAMAQGAKRAAYGARQLARISWYTGHYLAGRRLLGALTMKDEAAKDDGPGRKAFAPLDRGRLRRSFHELFQADWRNIETGEYQSPAELRRPSSLTDLLRASRDYHQDTQAVARRRDQNGHSEVLSAAAATRYPRYYLQNFHYQTDGWLSAASAARYDMQVETIFTGAAAPMRRQALPFVRRAIGARDPSTVTLLDLGCGTGVFLEEVLANWPELRTIALDLSPAYLARAKDMLAGHEGVRFLEAMAEATTLPDASVDVVTAVYLFHELPPKVRRLIAAEIARVLKPGGAFVLADTIQYGDEPGFDILLDRFPRAVHEPYYDSYCREDLTGLFGERGLVKGADTLAFLTKVTAFAKQAA